jgi:beta-phosphoglucomutase-like phosphatase (HAD superfamily)
MAALDSEGIDLSVWRIHRKIGMSGGLLSNMLLRETGLALDQQRIERLQRLHVEAYKRNSPNVRPLPGAHALLTTLTNAEIPWAIATSRRLETAGAVLETLGIDLSRIPVVTPRKRKGQPSAEGSREGSASRSQKEFANVRSNLGPYPAKHWAKRRFGTQLHLRIRKYRLEGAASA